MIDNEAYCLSIFLAMRLVMNFLKGRIKPIKKRALKSIEFGGSEWIRVP